MKKFTLFAAMAAVVASANAQYTTNKAATSDIEGNISQLYSIVLDEETQLKLEAKGTKVNFIGVNDTDRFLYVWSAGETLTGIESPVGPGADGGFGYTAFDVTGETWFGAGYYISYAGAADLSGLTPESRFHFAYKSTNGLNGMYVNILASDASYEESGTAVATPADQLFNPGKFSLGVETEGGAVIGTITDSWQAVDMTLADLAKVSGTLQLPTNKSAFFGNIVSFGGGAENGKDLYLDAIYFYNLGAQESIDAIESETREFIVNGKVVNMLGGNGIEMFNLNGQLVKSTMGAALDASDVESGVYVVRSANKVAKIVL